MGQFVCDGTCAGNELGDCNHGDSNDGLGGKRPVSTEPGSDEELKPLTFAVHESPGDDLTCLLCHTPTFEGGERSHHPRCEYGVSFLTMSGSAVAGLHRRCYERAKGR